MARGLRVLVRWRSHCTRVSAHYDRCSAKPQAIDYDCRGHQSQHANPYRKLWHQNL